MPGPATDGKVIGSSSPAPWNIIVEAFLASLSLVAVAEIGDKTQLLAFMLAARFKGRHWAIIAAILVATLANHAVAASFGGWIAVHVDGNIMRWLIGAAFLAFAAWALVPDTYESTGSPGRYGAFLTTLVLFFVAEMGDKTQLATVALSAQYLNIVAVTAGTTVGMMIANVPAVLVGERLAQKFPLGRMRFVAAALFALFGLLILFGVNFGMAP